MGGALSRSAAPELAAGLADAEGRPAEAAGLFAAADKIRTQHQLPLPGPEADELALDLAGLRDQLGAEAFAAAQKAGQSWDDTELWRLIKPVIG